MCVHGFWEDKESVDKQLKPKREKEICVFSS